MNESSHKFRTALPVKLAPRQASLMYLARLRTHLARGKSAVSEALATVSGVPSRVERNAGK